MGSNTRGKIKEHLEGMHKNLEGYKAHCEGCLALIQDKNETAKQLITNLLAINDQLDDFTLLAYAKM